jgi:hypothetical protein
MTAPNARRRGLNGRPRFEDRRPPCRSMACQRRVDHPLPSREGRVRVPPFVSSRAGRMAAIASLSFQRPVAEDGLYPHPNPSPEGRGASEELRCPRVSVGHLGRGENRCLLTPTPEESPRIIMGRRGCPSSPLSLRERGLGVRVKISEAGRRVPEGSRVRSSVRPTKRYPHPALSRRERVVYARDRAFKVLGGDSLAPTLSPRGRGERRAVVA